MLLICNNRAAAVEIVETVKGYRDPSADLRLRSMRGQGDPRHAGLHDDPLWQTAVREVALLEDLASLESPLGDPTDPGVRA